jgi:hypothetical protein
MSLLFSHFLQGLAERNLVNAAITPLRVNVHFLPFITPQMHTATTSQTSAVLAHQPVAPHNASTGGSLFQMAASSSSIVSYKWSVYS